MAEEREHARLSASDSKRWLFCPGSIKLCEDAGLVSETSEAAEEGTLAHDIAEIEAGVLLGKYTIGEGMQLKDKLSKTEAWGKYYNAEMHEYAKEYAQFVSDQYYKCLKKDPATIYFLEEQVDFSHIVPEGYGFIDFGLVSDKVAYVADFKYGKGVYVDCKDNTQMMLYALGFIEKYGFLYDIEKVSMSIIQPRMNNISTWEVDAERLIDWGENFVKPRAEAAFNGSDEFGVTEDGCKWCPANPQCRALAAQRQSEVPDITKNPNLLTDQEIANLLAVADDVVKYFNKLTKFALEKALDGANYPGYKLVAGKSNRAFTNYPAIVEVLKGKGFTEAELYGDRPQLGIGDMEKLLGRQAFEEYLSSYIVKPNGKPTLVPVSDKREAVSVKSVEETFKDVEI